MNVSDNFSEKELGAVFTPVKTVEHIISRLGKIEEGKKILDPCVGPGIFIKALLKYGVKKEQIYAYDLDDKDIKKERSKLGTRALFVKWKQKLQGHFNYYGVSGNIEMLMKYYHETLEIMFKWLNRRSQRKSCTWEGFMAMVEYYGIPRPRIIGYWD